MSQLIQLEKSIQLFLVQTGSLNLVMQKFSVCLIEVAQLEKLYFKTILIRHWILFRTIITSINFMGDQILQK